LRNNDRAVFAATTRQSVHVVLEPRHGPAATIGNISRTASTGENYLYFMNGATIFFEGYIRTVADLNWQIVAVGDYDGDSNSDLLWRNSSTGENYLYPLNYTTIKSNEGYVRTVADQHWQVQR
jgi:hypothetical protein